MHLPVRAPFHLEATVRVLQRRPANLIDRWEAQRYRRAIRVHGRPMLIEVENCGTIEAPDLELTILGRPSPRSVAAAADLLREILGLDLDPSPPQRRAEAEPALRDTARALRGMRPPRYPDLLETFANVIPFQQVSLEAGMAVVAHLVRRFGENFLVNGPPPSPLPERADSCKGAPAKPQGLWDERAQVTGTRRLYCVDSGGWMFFPRRIRALKAALRGSFACARRLRWRE